MVICQSHKTEIRTPEGLLTLSDPVTVTITKIALTIKMGIQPILSVRVPVKNIKGAAHQHYGDGDLDELLEFTRQAMIRFGK